MLTTTTDQLPATARADDPAGTPSALAARTQLLMENRTGYALIAVFVALMYCSIIGLYLKFTSSVLPMGDPFTYTMGYFLLLDTAQHDFWAGISMALSANWYWMLNLPIALLSPILIKEPFSLSVVNFIMWGFATASFFRLARHLGYGLGVAFLASLVMWLFPINFGFQDYSSIPVLGLDSMFMALLNMAVANLLVFAIDPASLRNASLAGISVGLALWGRGNSVLVVGMVTLAPVLMVWHAAWKSRSIVARANNAVFVAIAAAMMGAFYLKMGGPIAEYYTAHLAFVQRHAWNWSNAMPYILNVPGFFFWRAENSVPAVALTWMFHAMVAGSTYAVWRLSRTSARRVSMRMMAITGAFIYFVTLIANIVLFTDPLISLYNALLIYAPMRIGMTLAAVAILGVLVSTRGPHLARRLMVPAMALVVVYGVWLTDAHTPQTQPGMPTPREVEAFAKSLDTLLKGDSISVLWYRHYSPSILRYYLRKNDGDLNLYMDKYYNDIWAQFDYGEGKRMKVREELRNHFENAGALIIPEYVDYYSPGYPYSYYRLRDEFPRYLNARDSPRFVVRMILQEYDNQRLLVIQRESDAQGQGEPLKLPYRESTEPHEDYGPKAVRFTP